MATFYPFKPIVTKDLVYLIDATNSKCFSPGIATCNSLGNKEAFAVTVDISFSNENGGSFLFDGVSSYIDTSTATIMGIEQCSSPFSITMWFKTIGTSQYYLFDNEKGNGISISIDNGIIKIYMSGSTSGEITTQFGSGYNNGNWNNLVVVWTVSSLNVYMNSTLIGQYIIIRGRGLSGIFETEQEFRIGNRWSASDYFPGNISTVSVYNRQLDEEEIIQNYNATKSRFTKNIITRNE